ncbi:MAG: TrmO family methyltransferase domain-containing protein [Tangfeifania sp.]
MNIESIGTVTREKEGFSIQVQKEFIPGLKGLEGFSHLQIIWWAHLTDIESAQRNLVFEKLFKKGPTQTGVFATRAPSRPNPIMMSTIKVTHIDIEKGIILTPFIDAEPETPVLDIKPYHPMDRVKNCEVPEYRKHWPRWMEEAATFNWKDEIWGA